MTVAAAYTEEDVLAARIEISGLSRRTREYLEHILGNGLTRIKGVASLSPARVDAEIDRITNELMETGLWEVRRLRGR